VCVRERERDRGRKREKKTEAVYCKEYHRKPISTSTFLKSKIQN